MTEPLQVGQFGIVEHEPVDRSPNAGIFQGKGAPGERTELFLIAEGTTAAGESFAGHIVTGIGEAWSHLDMSLTGALRRVFAEARHETAEWNRTSVPEHQVYLGMGCFARKGDYSVIAQAGPTIAFHQSGSTVTPYTPPGDAANPIGAEGPAEPRITRIRTRPGDRILLVSTAALDDVDDEIVAGILRLPGVKALQDLYRRVKRHRHLTVVLIEVPASVGEEDQADEEQAEAAPPPPPQQQAPPDEPMIGGPNTRLQRKALQPSLFVDSPEPKQRAADDAREKLTPITRRQPIQRMTLDDIGEEVKPLERTPADNRLGELAATQRQRASRSSLAAASAAAVAQSASSRPSWRSAALAEARISHGGFDDGGPGATSQSFTRGLVRERSNPLPDPGRSDAPLPSEIVRARRTVAIPAETAEEPADAPLPVREDDESAHYEATPLVKPRSNMGGRWRANGALSRRTIGGVHAPSTRLVVGIGLALLLILVGFLTAPRIFGNDDGSRVAGLVEQAEQHLSTAQVQDAPGERRSALTSAQALLLEAEQVGGQTTTTQELLNEVQSELETLDAIVEPAVVEELGSLRSYGDSAITPATITAGPGMVFLLDTTAGQVIAQPRDGSNASTIYAEDADAGLGRPAAIAYLHPATSTNGGNLLIADGDGGLWSFTPADGLGSVELNLPDDAHVTDIATRSGELFVLDADAGIIYRMTGIDGAFPYEAQVFEEREELRGASHIMVRDEVFVSTSAGSLQRYSGELMLELSQGGIDHRLTHAATPWITDDGLLAIADPSRDRIAVFNVDGSFVRQYRHQHFQDMSAFTMDGEAGFVFAGGSLYHVTWDEPGDEAGADPAE